MCEYINVFIIIIIIKKTCDNFLELFSESIDQ